MFSVGGWSWDSTQLGVTTIYIREPITDVDDLAKPFDLNEKLREQVPSFRR